MDLAQFQETFSETFRTPLNVSPWGPSRWIAHTPWNGDFGDARFANPGPDFPFRTGVDGLTITARKNAAGRWEAGLLCSLDAQGRGFAQTGGYFEARMKMPAGPGVWPAFWLVTRGDRDANAEIDVVEYYGHDDAHYQTAIHTWPKDKTLKGSAVLEHIGVPPAALSRDFHTYGAELSADFVRYFLDRKEVWRTPSTRYVLQPTMILINLALGSGFPIDKTPDPSVLAVDYVKAFQPRALAPQR